MKNSNHKRTKESRQAELAAKKSREEKDPELKRARLDKNNRRKAEKISNLSEQELESLRNKEKLARQKARKNTKVTRLADIEYRKDLKRNLNDMIRPINELFAKIRKMDE